MFPGLFWIFFSFLFVPFLPLPSLTGFSFRVLIITKLMRKTQAEVRREFDGGRGSIEYIRLAFVQVLLYHIYVGLYVIMTDTFFHTIFCSAPHHVTKRK